MDERPLNILVLRGGPDRERPVSFKSGAQVAAALREAGHQVREADIGPGDLSALDDFAAWPGDVVFPVLHGRWGEGGPLQEILDERQLPYVGCAAPAARLCIDKHRTKLVLEQHGLDTPAFELVTLGQTPTIAPPAVVKVPAEGSSIGLAICPDDAALTQALHELFNLAPKLLIEQFIPGAEVTVGVISEADGRGITALPPIHIVPAVSYYDYDAKYDRDDTQYRFELPGGQPVIDTLQQLAVRAHKSLGCRHLSRVDFILDAAPRPWCLEINTMPGFTTHSLLPMAAKHAGLDMPALTDRLARLGAAS
jgi:D-alanine-D-alanine ligase